MNFRFQSTGAPFLLEARLVAGPGTTADFAAAFRAQEAQVDALLLQYGAVLFRDTGIASAVGFQVTTESTYPQVGVRGRQLPPHSAGRRHLQVPRICRRRVHLVTQRTIVLAHVTGQNILFCQQPAADEEIPLVDSRQLLKALAPAVVEEFEHRRLCYFRNLHGARRGPSWRRTFETTDHAAAAALVPGRRDAVSLGCTRPAPPAPGGTRSPGQWGPGPAQSSRPVSPLQPAARDARSHAGPLLRLRR